MNFRQKLFEYRSYTPLPFLIVMIIVAHPTIATILIGLCIVLGGEFLRLWGVAIAGSETRTTGPVGGTFLITRGPFAFVRNPLYVGNIMMYSGIGIMSNSIVLALIALIYFLFQYSVIVSLEEEYLLKTFGNEFSRYCQAVPRFFPSLRKYTGGDHPQPDLDWKRGLISEKRTLEAIAFMVVLVIVLWQVRA